MKTCCGVLDKGWIKKILQILPGWQTLQGCKKLLRHDLAEGPEDKQESF